MIKKTCTISESSGRLEIVMTAKLLFTIMDDIEEHAARVRRELGDCWSNVRDYFVCIRLGEKVFPDDSADVTVTLEPPVPGYITGEHNPVSDEVLLYMPYHCYRSGLYREGIKIKDYLNHVYFGDLNKKVSLIAVMDEHLPSTMMQLKQDAVQLEEPADLTFWPFYVVKG